jgi:hypothetical protein
MDGGVGSPEEGKLLNLVAVGGTGAHAKKRGSGYRSPFFDIFAVSLVVTFAVCCVRSAPW